MFLVFFRSFWKLPLIPKYCFLPVEPCAHNSYFSMSLLTWIVHSICPSISSWSLILQKNISKIFMWVSHPGQKVTVLSPPQSRNNSFKKYFCNVNSSMSWLYRSQREIFLSHSTPTTIIRSCFFCVNGKPVMKSKDFTSHFPRKGHSS